MCLQHLAHGGLVLGHQSLVADPERLDPALREPVLPSGLAAPNHFEPLADGVEVVARRFTLDPGRALVPDTRLTRADPGNRLPDLIVPRDVDVAGSRKEGREVETLAKEGPLRLREVDLHAKESVSSRPRTLDQVDVAANLALTPAGLADVARRALVAPPPALQAFPTARVVETSIQLHEHAGIEILHGRTGDARIPQRVGEQRAARSLQGRQDVETPRTFARGKVALRIRTAGRIETLHD